MPHHLSKAERVLRISGAGHGENILGFENSECKVTGQAHGSCMRKGKEADVTAME